jgi:hypothetical protein
VGVGLKVEAGELEEVLGVAFPGDGDRSTRRADASGHPAKDGSLIFKVDGE